MMIKASDIVRELITAKFDAFDVHLASNLDPLEANLIAKFKETAKELQDTLETDISTKMDKLDGKLICFIDKKVLESNDKVKRLLKQFNQEFSEEIAKVVQGMRAETHQLFASVPQNIQRDQSRGRESQHTPSRQQSEIKTTLTPSKAR